MDIYEISERTNISIKTLRKLENLELLNTDKAKNEIVGKTKDTFRRCNPPTVEQLVYFFKNQKDIKLLGKWSAKMTTYIYLLGPVSEERMPFSEAQAAMAARYNDKNALNRIAEWVGNFIDESPAFSNGRTRGHAYLAVRMLADVPDDSLKDMQSAIAQVLPACRHTERMAGYWRLDPDTKKSRYCRPQVSYDL